ncbi:MAG: GGDEF domain-containing protein [bacterium]|nr:GGDEF domain-containing protein [bacterium]
MKANELDFRERSTFYIALLGAVLTAPFAINHLVQARYHLGGVSLVVVFALAVNAWMIGRGRYSPTLSIFTLTPIIMVFLSAALHKQGIIGALWCYPAVITFYFVLPERVARMAVIILLILTVPQIWSVLDYPIATRVTITLLAVSIFSDISLRIIANQRTQLHVVAVTDHLTGVGNRVLLHEHIEQAIARSSRSSQPMALIAMDIDHFKRVNDTLGHDAGDAVLKGIGEYLRRSVRSADRVFRAGGEEFLILLHDTDSEGARNVSEKLRFDISNLDLLPDHPVTVSIGVSALQPEDDRNSWVKRCDEKLYLAKKDGRNMVVC